MRQIVGAYVLALTAGALACRYYERTSSDALSPGGRVRVVLSERGSATVASSVGPRGEAIDGRLTSSSDSALVLSVTQVTRIGGVEEPWKGESVVVPRDAIAVVQREKISTLRTALFSTAIAAGAFLVGRSAAGSNIGGGRGGGKGGQQ